MTLFFAIIPLLYGVLLSVTWLLGADLLDRAPRFVHARLYSTMGACSMLGGLAGAVFGKTFADRLSPQAFLLLGAALLVCGASVAALAHRTFPVDLLPENSNAMPGPDDGEAPSPGALLGLLNNRYTVLLAAVGMIASVVGVLIELQFYWGASSIAPTEREKLHLFANFYLVLNALAVLLQVIGAPVLQRRFGVYGSLLILPAALLGVAMVVALSASALARASLRVAEGGLKSSIHRSNWEQAYLPLDRSRRAVAKILVDGVASRIGEGTAAALLLAAPPDISGGPARVSWITVVLIAGSVAWLLLTVRLRSSRSGPDLLPESPDDFRTDLPIPDGCITALTVGDGLQRHKLNAKSSKMGFEDSGNTYRIGKH
jgi:ATP/ADP translocase